MGARWQAQGNARISPGRTALVPLFLLIPSNKRLRLTPANMALTIINERSRVGNILKAK
jgi:hypothetical protein